MIWTIVQKETSKSWDVVYLRCRMDQYIHFREWQFVMIESTHIHPELNKPLRKPYSIASTMVDMQDMLMWWIIKKTCDGFMSQYLVWAQIWEVLTITWPAWKMVLQTPHATKYLLIATWSGLGPLWSIYQTIKHCDLIFLFWERYPDQVLDSITHWFALDDRCTLFLSSQWEYVQHWLDRAIALLWIDMHVYICGKPAMVDDVKSILHARGIVHIFDEKY